MPNESINLYLSIQSGSSERTLTSLADKTQSLDKESQLLKQTTEGLASANKPLLEQQTKLQAELKSSQKSVTELQKAYDEYGDEVSKLKLDEAVENHARLKQELTEVNAQIGANQKTYKEYLETVRKGGLQDSGGSTSGVADGSGSSLSSILGGLGAGKMLSGLVENIADYQISSALGSSMGSAVSGALSSAISGAALGTAIAPGIGTAIGAVLGGLTGGISGATEIAQAKDDAFIEYYNGLIDTYGGLNAGNTGSGSAIAAGRETDRISFKTLFGDEQAADDYLENLVDMSNQTPFLYDDLVSMSKTLATYGYNESNILPLLQTIGDAGAALGMGTSDMTTVAQALGRMKSSDKATLEYLNMLNDRGIGAVGMLADALDVSQGDMYDMISKGKISGTDAVKIITDALKDAYVGSMLDQSKTFSGLSSTLEGLQQEVANAAGEGYNTLRSDAIQTEIDSLGGPLGDAMKEINTIIGENQARSENLQEEYMREAIAAVLLGEEGGLLTDKEQEDLNALRDEYVKWSEEYAAGNEEAGLHMQSLYEQAQALGKAYYESSGWAQEAIDVQLEQIEAIRENTAGLAAASDAFRLAQEKSKGQGFDLGSGDWYNSGLNDSVAAAYTPSYVEKYSSLSSCYSPSSHAFGLDRVPYDDYPALLHEGERVLTAGEARAMDGESGAVTVQVTVSGNNFVGTGEEMADQIAEILVRKLEQAAVAAAPR